MGALRQFSPRFFSYFTPFTPRAAPVNHHHQWLFNPRALTGLCWADAPAMRHNTLISKHQQRFYYGQGQAMRKLCAWLEDNIEETFSFYRLLRQHHKNLKSTNILSVSWKRSNGGTLVACIFPNAVAWRFRKILERNLASIDFSEHGTGSRNCQAIRHFPLLSDRPAKSYVPELVPAKCWPAAFQVA
jgi:Transposase, Mutator family